jgi:hypothetical protein
MKKTMAGKPADQNPGTGGQVEQRNLEDEVAKVRLRLT